MNFQDEILDTSLQPDNNPRYTIRDNQGNVINDDIQLELKTPVTQEGTPLNKALFNDIDSRLLSVSQYNIPRIVPQVTNMKDINNFGNTRLWNSGVIISDACYGNGLYVIVSGGGYIATSTDRVTWTSRTTPTSVDLNSVEYAEGIFVVAGEDRTILTSPDGITWTQKSRTSDLYFNKVAHGNDGFVVTGVGEEAAGGNINSAYSLDGGETWTKRIVGTVTDSTYVFFLNNQFVYSTSNNAIYTSQSASGDLTLKTSSGIYAIDMIYYKGQYVAISKLGRLFVSSDLITWKDIGVNFTIDTSYASLINDGEQFLVASRTGNIMSVRDFEVYEMSKTYSYITNASTMTFLRDESAISIISSLNTSSTTVLSSRTNAYEYTFHFDDIKKNAYVSNEIIKFQCGKVKNPSTNSYVTTFINPYININNLGSKKVKGKFIYGELYQLMYDGTNFYAVSGKSVVGRFSSTSEVNEISLGFSPDLVIVYFPQNNDDVSISGGSGSPTKTQVPRILTKAYLSSYGRITENGFSYSSYQESSPFYIAIKF